MEYKKLLAEQVEKILNKYSIVGNYCELVSYKVIGSDVDVVDYIKLFDYVGYHYDILDHYYFEGTDITNDKILRYIHFDMHISLDFDDDTSDYFMYGFQHGLTLSIAIDFNTAIVLEDNEEFLILKSNSVIDKKVNKGTEAIIKLIK